MEESMFYLILAEQDFRLVRHPTLEKAALEAIRLADKERHTKFFILKAKYVVRRAVPISPPPEIVPLHRFTVDGEY